MSINNLLPPFMLKNARVKAFNAKLRNKLTYYNSYHLKIDAERTMKRRERINRL